MWKFLFEMQAKKSDVSFCYPPPLITLPGAYSPDVQSVQRTPCNITGTSVNYVVPKFLYFLVFNICNVSAVGVFFFFFGERQIAFFSTPTDDRSRSHREGGAIGS